MTSKQRRYPLKRVRPDNENQESIISSNGRINKKFCRQPSEDSAFAEIEKSSDERAFDLFHKEYFPQLRPYFKHRSIVIQFIEHLWSNMIESSKVSFVRKILKEQGIYDVSSTSFNDTDAFSNDENDSQISKSLNESNVNHSTWNSNNRYTRAFLNDLLSYLKYWITPRFNEKKSSSSSKMIAPLRRSSRIRRAPIKCVCSTCIITRASEEHSSSTSITNEDSENQVFRHLMDHYHQLDDQYVNQSNSSILINNDQLNDTNDNQIQTPLSEILETATHVKSSPPIIPMISVGSNDAPLPSFDLLIDPPMILNDKLPLDITNECPTRRTYVILTELDEPFFGPYPIEFTITI